jgi:hypothetical protein
VLVKPYFFAALRGWRGGANLQVRAGGPSRRSHAQSRPRLLDDFGMRELTARQADDLYERAWRRQEWTLWPAAFVIIHQICARSKIN